MSRPSSRDTFHAARAAGPLGSFLIVAPAADLRSVDERARAVVRISVSLHALWVTKPLLARQRLLPHAASGERE